MELYTLDSNFLKKDVVDTFTSVIWTERYSTAGEVTLTVPATPAAVEMLAEGTFLATPESKEVMLLETQSSEAGLLTVTGNTLVDFLKYRVIWTTADHTVRYWYLSGFKPGEVLTHIVQQMCIAGYYMDFHLLPNGLLKPIPNLSIGDIDMSHGEFDIAVPIGRVYDALQKIAETYHLGMSMYLDSADESGYSLKFKSYAGRNLTSNQDVYPIVRFSPAMDSLTDIKEVRSLSGYCNVIRVYAPAEPIPGYMVPGSAYADEDSLSTTGFDRRVGRVFAEDITSDEVGGSTVILEALLNQRALDAIAAAKPTRVVDGEIVPQSEFQYGTHYKLGDIVELEGNSGFIQLARVTEYIRAQDSSGDRKYPTVSVITEAERDGWFGGTD